MSLGLTGVPGLWDDRNRIGVIGEIDAPRKWAGWSRGACPHSLMLKPTTSIVLEYSILNCCRVNQPL